MALSGSRFDKNKMYQKRYWSDRLLALVAEYRALAAEAQMSVVDLAYAWLAGTPGVDSNPRRARGAWTISTRRSTRCRSDRSGSSGPRVCHP